MGKSFSTAADAVFMERLIRSLQVSNFKISIITAVYNAADTIEQTIRSVVEQDYPNIEYIIIDGGSTDGTLDVIKKYEDRIAYWVSEPDKGIYDAMNKGLSAATGDYIYYLGADDCLYDTAVISKIVSCLKSEAEPDVLCGAVMMVDPVYRIEKVYHSFFSEEAVLSGYNAPHQGMFVRRAILNQHPFDIDYRVAADYKNFLIFYLDSNIILRQTDLIVAYYANDGISGSEIEVQCMEYIRALQENGLDPSDCIKKRRGYLARIKNIAKKRLRKTRALKCLLLHYGWKRHSCSWEFCRWCK